MVHTFWHLENPHTAPYLRLCMAMEGNHPPSVRPLHGSNATTAELATECVAVGEAWTGIGEDPMTNATSGDRSTTTTSSSGRHRHQKDSRGLLGFLGSLPAPQAADLVQACLAPHVLASARAQEAWQGVLGPCLGRLYTVGLAGSRRNPEAAATRLEATLREGVRNIAAQCSWARQRLRSLGWSAAFRWPSILLTLQREEHPRV